MSQGIGKGAIKGLDTLGKSSVISDKSDNICDFLFALLQISPLLMCRNSNGRNSFLFKDPFFRRGQNNLTELSPLKMRPFLLTSAMLNK